MQERFGRRLAFGSPAASQHDREYIKQWRSAASPWNKAFAAGSGFISALRDRARALPTLTIIAGATGAALALALAVVLFRQRSSANEVRVDRTSLPLYSYETASPKTPRSEPE